MLLPLLQPRPHPPLPITAAPAPPPRRHARRHRPQRPDRLVQRRTGRGPRAHDAGAQRRAAAAGHATEPPAQPARPGPRRVRHMMVVCVTTP